MEHFPLINRLHTDVLEDKYGTITAHVLKHTQKIRAAHLIDKQKISRTFALTFFDFPWTKEIEEINSIIKEGFPIGKAFRTKEYAIRKNVIDVYIIKLPDSLKKQFKTTDNFAKARLSEFYAKKRTSKPIIYGVVVEIYAPDFRSPIINNVDIAQINATTESLQTKKISMETIWNELGNDQGWHTITQEKILEAKKESLPQIFKYKKRIEKELEKI